MKRVTHGLIDNIRTEASLKKNSLAGRFSNGVNACVGCPVIRDRQFARVQRSKMVLGWKAVVRAIVKGVLAAQHSEQAICCGARTWNLKVAVGR